MNLNEVLLNKQEVIRSAQLPRAIDFNVEEINVLCDKTQLRVLKVLYHNIELDLEQDIETCIEKIKTSDTLIPVLEYCAIRNAIVKEIVKEIFD